MKKLRFKISKGHPTPIRGDSQVYQDCVLGMCHDAEGKLWVTAGHSGYGHIGVFKGEDASALKELYPAKGNFNFGVAGEAFCGSRYPDGPLSRGEYWGTGLWIDPESGRFHALVHNETGWSAGSSAYTAFRQEDGEPDFRHIGYLISDDQGKTWDFVRWAITAYEPCYTEKYQPDQLTGGQFTGIINLGAGDLSVFYHEKERALYLYYSMLWYDMDDNHLAADKVYCAKATLGEDGLLSDFVKYCNGSFSTAGNCGRESAILTGGAEPCVAYSETIGRYIMTSYNRDSWVSGKPTLQVAYSDDLVTWSKPELCVEKHAELSLPYYTVAGRNPKKAHNHLEDTFDLLACSNNTDVLRFEVTVEAYEEDER